MVGDCVFLDEIIDRTTDDYLARVLIKHVPEASYRLGLCHTHSELEYVTVPRDSSIELKCRW